MNSKVALTSFTRDYNYLKSADIWSSKVHFDKMNLNEFYTCKPTAFFVYSSKFFVKSSKTKTLNLVITLVYDFKPVVVKIIPFNSLVSTCSFAKDPFRPILFVGEEDGHVSILNLNCLDNIQWLKPDFCQKTPVTLADWLNEKIVLFSFSKELFGWNIVTGQIELIYACDEKNSITYFTCSSFSPNLVAIGLFNGEIIILNFEKDEKFVELFRLDFHKESICSMSFTVGKGKYSNPILASISLDGHLIVWNLDKKDKIFEDNLKITEVKFKFYTVLFMDDLYERDGKKSDLKSINDDKDNDLNFMKNPSTQKKELNYFQLLATNSNGILQEYKVPKYLINSNFKVQQTNFRVLQFRFTKIYSILVPRSFQSILRIQKLQKGDHHKLTNNNNYPIMIQITQKHGCFHFAVLDLQIKKQVQTIPLLSNAITGIDFNPLRSNTIAVTDLNGFIVWNLPNFESGINQIYDLSEKRKGFFRKFSIRVTCLNWSPVKENLLVIGTRTGLIFVYNLDEHDPIVNSIQLSRDVYPNPYIYSIYWGPNVLDEKPQMKKDNKTLSFRQQFDYIYSVVDGGKIGIINLNSKTFLNFIDIADVYIEKQWTEINWKSDYTLLAVGNSEGSVDIFSNDLFKIGKLKHIITIDEIFKSPIESVVFHPIFLKKNDRKSSSTKDNVIAIAGTENTIKIIDLTEYVQKAKIETQQHDLPFILNKVDKVLDDHKGRVFKLSWSPFKDMQLLSCSEDKTVKVWNCEKSIDQSLITTYYGHFGRVLVAKFSQTEPDTVISGGSDSILAIWKISEQTGAIPQPIQCSSAYTIKPFEFQQLVKEIDNISDDKSEEKVLNVANSQNQHDLTDNRPDLKEVLKDGKLINRYIDGDREVCIIEKYNEANEKLTVTHYRSLKSQSENLTTNDNLNSIDNSTDYTEKRKRRRQEKNKNETKAKSLLTLSTKNDNSLTKLAHYDDIDKMLIDCETRKKRDLDRKTLNAQLKRINNISLDSEQLEEIKKERDTILKKLSNLQGMVENKPKIDDETRSTFLLYGSSEDMECLSKREIINHLKNDDSDSANLVRLLSNDLKTVIEEAKSNDQLNETLVAMSSSISLNYWQQTVQDYVEQLIKKGKIVMASCYLLSLFRIGDALDLLVKHHLYKEALMVAKTRFTSENNVYTQAIVHSLAHDYAKTGNYESEIKCWLSIDYLYEAARVFASRIDPISSKYLVRCCKTALKYNLEN